MKKIPAVILFLLYLAASSGATINFHYCMGKFIGWDIAVPAHATCNNCGMGKEQKKSCCNDKQAVFSVAKDQLASIISDVPNSHFVYTQPQYSSLVNASLIINDDVPQSIHSPPLIQPVPGFILNCIFRI